MAVGTPVVVPSAGAAAAAAGAVAVQQQQAAIAQQTPKTVVVPKATPDTNEPAAQKAALSVRGESSTPSGSTESPILTKQVRVGLTAQEIAAQQAARAATVKTQETPQVESTGPATSEAETEAATKITAPGQAAPTLKSLNDSIAALNTLITSEEAEIKGETATLESFADRLGVENTKLVELSTLAKDMRLGAMRPMYIGLSAEQTKLVNQYTGQYKDLYSDLQSDVNQINLNILSLNLKQAQVQSLGDRYHLYSFENAITKDTIYLLGGGTYTLEQYKGELSSDISKLAQYYLLPEAATHYPN